LRFVRLKREKQYSWLHFRRVVFGLACHILARNVSKLRRPALVDLKNATLSAFHQQYGPKPVFMDE